jgi:large subunit ribosomal protein L28
MSWKCDICGKQPSVGFRVSHSDKHTKHTWKPNLQSMRVLVKGKVKKLKVCTTCLKSNKVQKA